MSAVAFSPLDSLPVCPWKGNPYALVSLWEIVEKFPVAEFVQAMALVDTLCHGLIFAENAQRLGATGFDRPLGVWGDFSHAMLLHAASEALEKSGATASASLLSRLSTAISPEKTATQIAPYLGNLKSVMVEELGKTLFLGVRKDLAPFFSDPNQFGEAVAGAFPGACYDIRSAGECIALEQWTAAVFHLMRVVELTLDPIADALKIVRLDRWEWQNYINQFTAEIKKIDGPAWGADWKDWRDFYAPIPLELNAFKIAWRNHTMHSRSQYDEREAKRVFAHVESYMRRVSERLREAP